MPVLHGLTVTSTIMWYNATDSRDFQAFSYNRHPLPCNDASCSKQAIYAYLNLAL